MFLTFRAVFRAAYSFPEPQMSIKCPLITNLVMRKVEKKRHKKSPVKVRKEKLRT